MNTRSKRRRNTEPGILLSPLIDCVFLLLIFFLVTSMIKRFERQIPVALADDTSAITPDPRDEAHPIGVARDGSLYEPEGKSQYGVLSFAPMENPESFLSALIRERGGMKPVTVVVERGTSFQKVIRLQDRLELIGFENVGFRIRDFPFSSDSESREGGQR